MYVYIVFVRWAPKITKLVYMIPKLVDINLAHWSLWGLYYSWWCFIPLATEGALIRAPEAVNDEESGLVALAFCKTLVIGTTWYNCPVKSAKNQGTVIHWFPIKWQHKKETTKCFQSKWQTNWILENSWMNPGRTCTSSVQVAAVMFFWGLDGSNVIWRFPKIWLPPNNWFSHCDNQFWVVLGYPNLWKPLYAMGVPTDYEGWTFSQPRQPVGEGCWFQQRWRRYSQPWGA